MNDHQKEPSVVDSYIAFVEDAVKRFSEIGELTRLTEVPPDKVFKALASYYTVSLALNAEYQRCKIEKLNAELEYDSIYTDWFQEAKAALVLENDKKNAKPALKETEQLIKSNHKTDYYAWQNKLMVFESKCDFYLRLRETLNKYDSILTNLAMSLRSELRALSIEDRAESKSSHPKRFIPLQS